MAPLFSGLASLFTGGAAAGAAGAAGAVAGTAGAAATGISFSTILQGGLGLLSAVSQINAGNAEADNLMQQANDAKREQPLEALQGIARRGSIKKDMAAAIGGQDVANAASGVDLSFGTPGVARTEAFREGDTAVNSDAGTEQIRVARLAEKEANLRKMAGKAKSAAGLQALGTIFDTGYKIAGTWGTNGKQTS